MRLLPDGALILAEYGALFILPGQGLWSFDKIKQNRLFSCKKKATSGKGFVYDWFLSRKSSIVIERRDGGIEMKIRAIRHATMLVEFSGIKLLVDPMLGKAESMDAVVHSPNPRRNPLVALPTDAESLLQVDAVLLTHIHRDHFDDAAAQMIPRGMPILCQPPDEPNLREQGFSQVLVINDSLIWRGITINRTGGRHGTGEIGEKMGPVSGYVLQAMEENMLYIAGDTIWCEEVETALALYRPEVTVVFGGAAQFLEGGPITMAADDIARVCRSDDRMKVVVVHMEAFNHCLLTRCALRDDMNAQGLQEQLFVPKDGEELVFD